MNRIQCGSVLMKRENDIILVKGNPYKKKNKKIGGKCVKYEKKMPVR